MDGNSTVFYRTSSPSGPLPKRKGEGGGGGKGWGKVKGSTGGKGVVEIPYIWGRKSNGRGEGAPQGIKGASTLYTPVRSGTVFLWVAVMFFVCGG